MCKGTIILQRGLIGAGVCAILGFLMFFMLQILDTGIKNTTQIIQVVVFSLVVALFCVVIGGIIGIIIGIGDLDLIGGGFVGSLATIVVVAYDIFFSPGSHGNYGYLFSESRVIFVVLTLPTILTGIIVAFFNKLLQKSSPAKKLRQKPSPVKILVWFAEIMIMCIPIFMMTSIFFEWPFHLASFFPREGSLSKSTIYLYYNKEEDKPLLEELSIFLQTQGYMIRAIRKVDTQVREIRYFHDKDMEKVVLLQYSIYSFLQKKQDISTIQLNIKNFKNPSPQIPEGVLEVWIYF